MKIILSVVLFFLSVPLFAQQTIIHAGYIFNVDSEQFESEKSIIIEGDKIVDVKDGFVKAGKKDNVIDMKKQYVMPGFIDLHVHLESETGPNKYMERFIDDEADIAFKSTKFARTTLEAGFTTVRDLGGTGVNISLRNAINRGDVVGPRIYTSGKSIATTGGHADPTNGMKKDFSGDPGPADGVVNGDSDARKAVRQRYKNGADLIKITATGGVLSVAKSGQAPQFFEDEVRAIVETANDYGMHVAAHAHGTEGMRRAVEAGVLTIEHGTLMTEEVMALMIEKGTYYVPTISAGNWVAEMAKIKGYYPPLVVPKALEIGPQIKSTFAAAYKRGVNIAFGTDAGVFPHGQNAKEFELMVEAGMPAEKAIVSATKTAAFILGATETLGKIAPNFYADLVASSENPLKKISSLQSLSFVMKGGEVVR